MTFSIIIIGYNQKESACDAVRSALLQTYRDIEVLYVDDASTDGSVETVASAFCDERLKIIPSAENRGSLAARLSGIWAATGDWCLFVDGDDTLCPNACEVLAKTIAGQGRDADLIGFGAHMDCSGNVTEADKIWMERLLRQPLLGAHSAGELLRVMYVKREKSWVLWNKCVRIDTARAALAAAPCEPLYRLSDFCLCFFVCGEGTSYYGIADPLYRYRFGKGISRRPIDAAEIGRFASAYKAPGLLREYARKKGVSNAYEACFRREETASVQTTLDRFVLLSQAERPRAAQLLMDVIGAEPLLTTLWESLHETERLRKTIEARRQPAAARFRRAVAELPQKLIDAVHSLKTRGLRYTLRRALVRLHLAKDRNGMQ